MAGTEKPSRRKTIFSADGASPARAAGMCTVKMAMGLFPQLVSVPLVEGTWFCARGLIATALPKARAKPLNALSAIW